MRNALTIGFAIGLSLFVVACEDDDRPNEIPRTVPPVSTDGAAAVAPAIKGVGPSFEALAAFTAEG